MTALILLGLCIAGAEPAARFDPWAAPPSVAPGFIGGQKPAAAGPPKRVVTLVPSATELVFALGAGARVVAVSRYDDDPPEVKALPKIGGFVDPSVEAVVAARPDLVIGIPNAGNQAAIDRIAALGLPMLIVPGASLSDLAHAARAIGAALGGDAPARAERMLSEVRDQILRLREAAADRHPPRVLFVYGHDPLIVAGQGSFADTLLVALRAVNVVKVAQGYPTYALEQVLLDAPEVILDASGVHGDQARGFWSRWPDLPAVKKKRVESIQGTALLRPGPHLGEAMRQLAALLDR